MATKLAQAKQLTNFASKLKIIVQFKQIPNQLRQIES